MRRSLRSDFDYFTTRHTCNGIRKQALASSRNKLGQSQNLGLVKLDIESRGMPRGIRSLSVRLNPIV